MKKLNKMPAEKAELSGQVQLTEVAVKLAVNHRLNCPEVE
jgi:hypothetical protein